MTSKNRIESLPLKRLEDELVDDILAATDAEILSEATADGIDLAKNAADMRALFERSAIKANKAKLAAAQSGLAEERRQMRFGSPNVTDIKDARSKLRAVLQKPNLPEGFTVAARNESELSDDDVLGMLEDLAQLGININFDGGDGS